MHECPEGSLQGVAGRENGAHFVRVNSWEQDAGRQTSKGSRAQAQETSSGESSDKRQGRRCRQSAETQVFRHGSGLTQRPSGTAGFVRTLEAADASSHSATRHGAARHIINGTNGSTANDGWHTLVSTRCFHGQLAQSHQTTDSIQRQLLHPRNPARSLLGHTGLAPHISADVGKLPARVPFPREQ